MKYTGKLGSVAYRAAIKKVSIVDTVQMVVNRLRKTRTNPFDLTQLFNSSP